MAMQANPTIDDPLLSAWLDGELASQPELQARVQAYLDEHPEQMARVAQWRADGAALRGHFDPLLDEPVPPALERVVWRREARTPRWALVAAAVLLFTLGGVAGALLGASASNPATAVAGASSAGWIQRAAYAHSVYTAEPRHPVEVAAHEEHLSRWLSSRVKLPVTLYDLHAQGFELIGGRLLPDGGGKSAQLMYQDAQGVRVTVYLRKPDNAGEVELTYRHEGDLGLFYWVEDGTGCAIVGALPRERLQALAEAVYHDKAAPAGPPPRPNS